MGDAALALATIAQLAGFISHYDAYAANVDDLMATNGHRVTFKLLALHARKSLQGTAQSVILQDWAQVPLLVSMLEELKGIMEAAEYPEDRASMLSNAPRILHNSLVRQGLIPC